MPFYQFNHFTGRLKPSNQLLPLYPIPPVPLQHSEPPRILYETIKTKSVETAPAVNKLGDISKQATEGRPWHVSPKNWEFMKKLQADLEAPVFLAKGTPDKILFGVTVALVAWGFADSMYFLWQRATKRI